MIDSEPILIILIVLSIIVSVATTYLLSVGPNHKWYNLKKAVAIGVVGGSIAISLVTIPLALPPPCFDLWYSSEVELFPGTTAKISFVVKVPSCVVLADQQFNVSVIAQPPDTAETLIQFSVQTFSITLDNYKTTFNPTTDLNADIQYDKMKNIFGVKVTDNGQNFALDFICRPSSAPPLFIFAPPKV